MARERTLDEAILVALEGAQAFGTWDAYWFDYAGRDAARVRDADPALVRRIALDLAKGRRGA